MAKFLSGLFDSNEKELKRLRPYVDDTNELEPEFQKLTDDELKAKTSEFKSRITEYIASIQPALEAAQKELAEARECLAGAALGMDMDGADKQCQRAEDKLKQVEKERLELEKEALDDILPEAFAAVREAARRTIGQRHYGVPLIGGVTPPPGQNTQ